MWQLGLALLVLVGGAAVLRDRCILGVALTLLANWCVNTFAVQAIAETAPWGFFLVTDYLSGVFVLAGLGILCRRFTVGAALIALTYALQCLFHAAYGLSDHGPWPQYRYWWANFYVAVGQMMIVAGWGAYELARRIYRARRGLSPDPLGARCAPAPKEP